jgi:acylglycerol lipase
MSEKFFTDADGQQIYTHLFAVDHAKALVIVVHGYGEHSGRYAHVVRWLNDHGYTAAVIDHVGHGKSSGLKAFVPSVDVLTRNLRVLVQDVKAQFPALKAFMLGHSMGALTTLAYAQSYPSDLDGIVITGAPVDADANVSPLLVTVGNLLSKIIPTVPFLDLAPVTTISRDPAVVQAFREDTLCYNGKMRIGTGVAMNKKAIQVREGLPSMKLPMLIMHGEADQLVNPSGSKTAYTLSGSADKIHKTYPEAYHEIMNEPEKEAVLTEITTWLDAHR